MGRGERSPDSWRYTVIKHYKHRAEKFITLSETPEEKMAWGKVVKWFDDILQKKHLSRNGDIHLSPIDLTELSMEEKKQ